MLVKSLCNNSHSPLFLVRGISRLFPTLLIYGCITVSTIQLPVACVRVAQVARTAQVDNIKYQLRVSLDISFTVISAFQLISIYLVHLCLQAASLFDNPRLRSHHHLKFSPTTLNIFDWPNARSFTP